MILSVLPVDTRYILELPCQALTVVFNCSTYGGGLLEFIMHAQGTTDVWKTGGDYEPRLLPLFIAHFGSDYSAGL
jgi:hypothetical protein